MKRFCIITFIFIIAVPGFAQEKELRGTWFAWAGSNVPSKEDIAQTMESLAENNFNTVYVDVWRFGYPYFRSTVFEDITGISTDPRLEQGRDVLADMIAEGHRFGLEVEAWFEAGFAACHEDNDDLFDAHPEWFAQKSNGTVNFYSNGGIKYHWLSHCNEKAQQFIIDFCLDLAKRYDVDGIDFDRIRYPELNCGYDSATVALYKSEHDGAEPPLNYADPGWIRWRADKLTEFVGRLYHEVKSVNPYLT
ncbi:family 10 glycosylhydrolase, partial [candidate division KSB1 bacterium]|nr:family 10 glycosylhydrolase [candidate division KSB1 bacterium]